jgi:hypothetical protein
MSDKRHCRFDGKRFAVVRRKCGRQTVLQLLESDRDSPELHRRSHHWIPVLFLVPPIGSSTSTSRKWKPRSKPYANACAAGGLMAARFGWSKPPAVLAWNPACDHAADPPNKWSNRSFLTSLTLSHKVRCHLFSSARLHLPPPRVFDSTLLSFLLLLIRSYSLPQSMHL